MKEKTYSEELEALFIDTKSAINNLMILNQDQMYAHGHHERKFATFHDARHHFGCRPFCLPYY